MKLEFQQYQFWKIKKYTKKNKLFFFFNSSRIKSDKWLIADQLIKKYKLNYYTIHNNSILNILTTSLYKNSTQLICSIFLLIKPSYTKLPIIIKEINSLKPLFEPLALKLNNKIYSVKQFENLKEFNFIKNVENLKKLLILCNRMAIK